MKRIIALFTISLLIPVYGFSQANSGNNNPVSQKIITKKQLRLKSNLMTPEVLWSLGRVNEATVSPDKSTVLYGVTWYDVPLDKGNCDLYTVSVDGKIQNQLTFTLSSEYNPQWTPDGKKIGFMSAESGEMQMYEMFANGSIVKQVTFINGGISGFKYSPDGKNIVYTKEVKASLSTQDLYPDLHKATGKVINNLMYRHWDEWVETYTHIFYAKRDGNMITDGIDIMKFEPWESPLKPFGGMEQICWSPDGKSIAYSCRKKQGKEYALSTNSDIYIYNLATETTINLTEGMNGYDLNPVFSPDGKKIAWESMERDGYESDKQRLMVYDFASKTMTDYSKNFDQNANNLAWSDDNKQIYFISDWQATDEIYRLELKSGKIKKLTDGVHNYLNVSVAGSTLIGMQQSMSMPTEIFAVNSADGKETQLTFTNKELLSQLSMGRVEKRWIKTTDNKDMLTWVIYPPQFNPQKKYPTLLYCEGGPQSTVSQFWSYRWNFQIMAANGYIIVAPNRRGLPGFGKEWLEQISGDYGGQNMQDYLSAIDTMIKEPFVNGDKLGAVGASYGGFSVYWLAGNHNKRFKAFIAHDGMFNLESQYLETEEMWFVNWDLGGPFWDKTNATAQRSYASSPHRFVQNWDTPILIIHGEKDYRISSTQGMSAFNAAILKGVPAQMLYFPNENHWVLHPQNGVLWQRTFFGWLDKWLK